MFETALASLRFGASMVLGRPFHRGSLDRIVAAMLATHHEMGGVGDDSTELFGGPILDEETRRAVQGRRFRTQAIRAAHETSYYAKLFAAAGVDPRKLRFEDIAFLPVTPKEHLRDDAEAFARGRGRPAHCVSTTGTTGRPTSVWFSDNEMHLFGALSAITSLNQRIIQPDDVVQIAINTRARLGVHGVTFSAAAVGAALYPAGLISPEHTLASLAERHMLPGRKRRVSVMSTYPSHLGELVEAARTMGYRPADFGLERILLGGEILSAGLQSRAREVFGDIQFIENYGMTELMPYGANLCDQRHLHYEPAVGLTEVLDLETARRPAADGEPGVIVATPLPPFRETTMLLRYNTEDVVRPLDASTLDCSLRRLPATSHLLGKLRLAVRHDHGWTFVRDMVEALEAVDAVPLPARYGFWAEPGGVAVEVAARTDRAARNAVSGAPEERDVPIARLRLVADAHELARPLPLRCDLKEGSLGTPSQPPLAAAVTLGAKAWRAG